MNIYTAEFQGYLIKPDKNIPHHYVVSTEGRGGKIPDVLSGMFTTRDVARRAITSYLLSKPKKGIINEEEISKG